MPVTLVVIKVNDLVNSKPEYEESMIYQHYGFGKPLDEG